MRRARRQPRLLPESGAIEIGAAHLATAVGVGVEHLDGAIDLVEEVSQPQLRILTGSDGYGKGREIDVLPREQFLEQIGHILALVEQGRLPGRIGDHRDSLERCRSTFVTPGPSDQARAHRWPWR